MLLAIAFAKALPPGAQSIDGGVAGFGKVKMWYPLKLLWCWFFLSPVVHALETDFEPKSVVRLTKDIYRKAFIPVHSKPIAMHEVSHTKWGTRKIEHEFFEERFLDRFGHILGDALPITRAIFEKHYKTVGRTRIIQEFFEARSTKLPGNLTVCCTIDLLSRQKSCEYVGLTFRYQKDQAFLTFELMKEAYKRYGLRLGLRAG